MRNLDITRLQLELRRALRPAALYALLVLAGLVAGGIILKNQTFQKPWENYREVRVAFNDVKGVVPGTQQVRIAGVMVGVIKRSELVHGKAVLVLSIESKYGRVYRDARMRLRPSTPLQDMYVAVESRGTKAAGELGDDILPAQQTTSAVDIARVLDTFDMDTRSWFAALLDGLGKGLDDRGAALRAGFAEAVPFLDVARRTSSVLARRRKATRRLVSNLERLTSTLARRSRALTSLVRGGERTLGELSAHDVQLAAILRELPPTVQTLQTSLASIRGAEDELDPTLRRLDPVLASLRSGLQGLDQLGEDARPALAALRQPLRELRPLARALRPAGLGLRSAASTFSGQAPRYDRITSLLPKCLERLSAFFNNTMSVMKFADAGGAIPRAETSVSADTLSPLTGTPVSEPSLKRQPTCTPGGQQR